ncbi:MAG: 16S rRNA (uracil(1498)-N(3))-methyltransferase [Opitutaceae bacterium]|nr:16S rRNA (uracil(1498)-N(3))-methyltransferase [Opitutaceae bacterium]
MNLVLFRPEECNRPLTTEDPRARHIIEVLRRRPGESFDCGLVNGPRGRAQFVGLGGDGLTLRFTWQSEMPPPLAPIELLVGLPRPQTARKVIAEATTLGVARLVFFQTERGERSYADSTLWSSGEVERLLVTAVGQAFCTRMPEVARSGSLEAALGTIVSGISTRLALDNYEATAALGEATLGAPPAALAVGPERGWSAAEREILRGAGFILVHLGTRVLRTETACTAGLAVLKTRLGLW